jgi:serine/threonine protein kinase
LVSQPPINYLLDELNTLRCLAHPNIVQIHGFSIRSFSSFDIFMEYVQGLTLDQAYQHPDE